MFCLYNVLFTSNILVLCSNHNAGFVLSTILLRTRFASYCLSFSFFFCIISCFLFLGGVHVSPMPYLHILNFNDLIIIIQLMLTEVKPRIYLRKIHVNANLLLRKFSRCSVEVKCYLFKTYCSNLYCAPMWFDCTKTALKKLKVAYNNSLRRFMGLPWRNSASEMFVNLNIRSFDELLRMFVFGFRSRIINSNNLLISSIYNSTCRIYSSMWTWWDNLLYIFNS